MVLSSGRLQQYHLLPLLLLCCVACTVCTAESRPFAYMCDRTAELHVIWTPAAGDSNTTGARLCLYNQNQDSQPIVLTNATKSEVRVPDRRWHHLVYGLSSDQMTCRYYYKWKIEPISSVAPNSLASSGCSSATPFERCEIEVGRSQLCPNSPSSYNVPLECLVFPKNFTFLRDLCLSSTTIEPKPTGGPGPAVIVTSTVLSAAAAAGIIVLLLRRRRRMCGMMYDAEPGDEAGRLPPPPQPPAVSIFRLLSDRYQMRMFVEKFAGRRVPQCDGHTYLRLDPDTRECIQLELVPAA